MPNKDLRYEVHIPISESETQMAFLRCRPLHLDTSSTLLSSVILIDGQKRDSYMQYHTYLYLLPTLTQQVPELSTYVGYYVPTDARFQHGRHRPDRPRRACHLFHDLRRLLRSTPGSQVSTPSHRDFLTNFSFYPNQTDRKETSTIRC